MHDLPEAVSRLSGQGGAEAFLEPHHTEAAHLVTRLFERAMLRQRVTMSYDPTRVDSRRNSNGQVELADNVENARQALSSLAKAIPADCWGVLCDVCIYDKGLQEIEAHRRWPRRSAKLVLRIGLEQVASLRGLGASAVGRSRSDLQFWLPQRPLMFPESPN